MAEQPPQRLASIQQTFRALWNALETEDVESIKNAVEEIIALEARSAPSPTLRPQFIDLGDKIAKHNLGEIGLDIELLARLFAGLARQAPEKAFTLCKQARGKVPRESSPREAREENIWTTSPYQPANPALTWMLELGDHQHRPLLERALSPPHRFTTRHQYFPGQVIKMFPGLLETEEICELVLRKGDPDLDLLLFDMLPASHHRRMFQKLVDHDGYRASMLIQLAQQRKGGIQEVLEGLRARDLSPLLAEPDIPFRRVIFRAAGRLS